MVSVKRLEKQRNKEIRGLWKMRDRLVEYYKKDLEVELKNYNCNPEMVPLIAQSNSHQGAVVRQLINNATAGITEAHGICQQAVESVYNKYDHMIASSVISTQVSRGYDPHNNVQTVVLTDYEICNYQ